MTDPTASRLAPGYYVKAKDRTTSVRGIQIPLIDLAGPFASLADAGDHIWALYGSRAVVEAEAPEILWIHAPQATA